MQSLFRQFTNLRSLICILLLCVEVSASTRLRSWLLPGEAERVVEIRGAAICWLLPLSQLLMKVLSYQLR